MLVSAIICTRNRIKETLACIKSLMTQTCIPHEIIIVDSSDGHRLKEIIETRVEYSNVGITYIHTKPGLTYQRNRGVQLVKGDIIFFFDDDIVLDAKFIDEIMEIFKRDFQKIVGGAAGRIASMGKLTSWNILSLIKYIFFLPRYGNGRFRLSGFPTWAYGNNAMVVEVLPGGLTAYRKEVLNEFRFDENLRGYCYMEDDDFSYRVSRKYQNVYCPSAKVLHNRSPRQRDSEYLKKKMLVSSHYYLFKKNLPQTGVRKIAFWISLLGLCVESLACRNIQGFKGIIRGISTILDNGVRN